MCVCVCVCVRERETELSGKINRKRDSVGGTDRGDGGGILPQNISFLSRHWYIQTKYTQTLPFLWLNIKQTKVCALSQVCVCVCVSV